MKIIAIVAALIGLAFATNAQVAQDQRAYCTYLMEQAKAEAVQLRTPSLVSGITQSPLINAAPQSYVGVQDAISNIRRASATIALAKNNCAAYNSNETAALKIQTAISSLEKSALQTRLSLITQAETQINVLILESQKMVDAQNLTKPAVYALQSVRAKLETDKTAATFAIAALYIPKGLPDTPIHRLIADSHENNEEAARGANRLQRTGDWDLILEVGARHQLTALSASTGPYGEVTFTYNFGNKTEHRHLESASTAYGNWKLAQEYDVVQSARALEQQLQDNIAASDIELSSLLSQDALIEENLRAVANATTTNALVFGNQLVADQLVLRVEIGYTRYRLDAFKMYLQKNF